MAALTYDPFQGDGIASPHRPSLDNLGGAGKLNKTGYPPGPTGPSAEEWNLRSRIVADLARGAPVMGCTIAFAAGVPFVAGFFALNPALTLADLTLSDIGVGETEIEWPAGKLPPAVLYPVVTSCANAPVAMGVIWDEAARSITVTTYDVGASANADQPFTVLWF